MGYRDRVVHRQEGTKVRWYLLTDLLLLKRSFSQFVILVGAAHLMTSIYPPPTSVNQDE